MNLPFDSLKPAALLALIGFPILLHASAGKGAEASALAEAGRETPGPAPVVLRVYSDYV